MSYARDKRESSGTGEGGLFRSLARAYQMQNKNVTQAEKEREYISVRNFARGLCKNLQGLQKVELKVGAKWEDK